MHNKKIRNKATRFQRDNNHYRYEVEFWSRVSNLEIPNRRLNRRGKMKRAKKHA